VEFRDAQDLKDQIALHESLLADLHRAGAGETPLAASLAQRLGVLLQYADRWDEALAHLSHALSLYRAVGDRLGEANVLKAIGDVQNFRKALDAALASYTAALALFRQVGDRLGEANVLQAIGDVQNFQDELDVALASYETALGLYRQVGARLGEANVLKAIGDVHNFQGELDAALASYETALGLYRQVGARLGEANVLLALGRAALTTGETDQGLALLAQAREIYAFIGDRVGLTNVDLVLARHAAAQGDLVAAVEYMQSAADFAVEVGHPLASQLQAEMAERTFSLAQQHESLGDAARAAGHPQTPDQSSVSLEHYQAAITGYDRAQQLYTGLKAVEAAAFAALGVGRCLVKSGAWYRGLQKLRHEVLPAFRVSGNVVGEAQTFHQIGFVHQLLGDYELAEMGFQDAIRHYRQVDDELGVANVKVSRGHLAIQMQELEKAIALLNEALPVLEHRDGAQLTRAERLLALAQEALHQQAVLA
jgi:tetratricopeptide (TPR) repeat protein